MAADLVGLPRAADAIGVATPLPIRQVNWREAISEVGDGAFAVHASRHGSAPVTRADSNASARVAASGVQFKSHASAAIISVDLRSLATPMSAGATCSLPASSEPL